MVGYMGRLGASGRVAIATSAGVDSSCLCAAASLAGIEFVVSSFTLSDRGSSDFVGAAKLASFMGAKFLPAVIDISCLRERVRWLVVQERVAGKAAIECVTPFLFLFDALEQERIRTLVTGSSADGHFGLSKKAMINFRFPKERFDQWRRDYFANADRAQVKTVERLARDRGIEAFAPYFGGPIGEVMLRFGWEELNRPRQKEILRRAFPELEPLRLKRHVNLQLGDSGIAEAVGRAAMAASGRESPIKAYNELWRRGAGRGPR